MDEQESSEKKSTDSVVLFIVGAGGFEPPTSWSRTKRASRAALRPEQKHYTISFPAFQVENTSQHGKSASLGILFEITSAERGNRRD